MSVSIFIYIYLSTCLINIFTGCLIDIKEYFTMLELCNQPLNFYPFRLSKLHLNPCSGSI